MVTYQQCKTTGEEVVNEYMFASRRYNHSQTPVTFSLQGGISECTPRVRSGVEQTTQLAPARTTAVTAAVAAVSNARLRHTAARERIYEVC
ncbi:MAG: hypothetical protein NZ606_07840 [Candidatus Kapabacteria bacterium]|nr:hypothetical protein [Candidatus Kapabacteria bacterium]